MREPRRFLAVDLVIESRSNLAPLAAEFGERVLLLHCGPIPKPKGHSLVLSTWLQYKEADSAIQALRLLVETLSSNGRRLWEHARRKEFDIRYELGRTGFTLTELRFTLRPDTLQRVAGLGGSVGITGYRPVAEQRASRTEAGE